MVRRTHADAAKMGRLALRALQMVNRLLAELNQPKRERVWYETKIRIRICSATIVAQTIFRFTSLKDSEASRPVSKRQSRVSKIPPLYQCNYVETRPNRNITYTKKTPTPKSLGKKKTRTFRAKTFPERLNDAERLNVSEAQRRLCARCEGANL
jgi:hypothetical protein